MVPFLRLSACALAIAAWLLYAPVPCNARVTVTQAGAGYSSEDLQHDPSYSLARRSTRNMLAVGANTSTGSLLLDYTYPPDTPECEARFGACRHRLAFTVRGNDLLLKTVANTSCSTAEEFTLTLLRDEDNEYGNLAATVVGSTQYAVARMEGEDQLVFNQASIPEDSEDPECSGYYSITSGTLFGVVGPPVSAQAAAAPSNTGSTCFSASTLAETPTGPKSMDRLSIGDRVLVATPGAAAGAHRFEEIFMFSHRERDSVNPFISIETGRTHRPLQVSAGHYLWAAKQSPTDIATTNTTATPTPTRAADLSPGDLLWVSTASDLVPAAITSIKLTRGVGLYNPHTASGSVLVNGVAATTFTDVLPPSLTAHGVATFPARLLYHALRFRAAREAVNELVLAAYFGVPEFSAHMLASFLGTGGSQLK